MSLSRQPQNHKNRATLPSNQQLRTQNQQRYFHPSIAYKATSPGKMNYPNSAAMGFPPRNRSKNFGGNTRGITTVQQHIRPQQSTVNRGNTTSSKRIEMMRAVPSKNPTRDKVTPSDVRATARAAFARAQAIKLLVRKFHTEVCTNNVIFSSRIERYKAFEQYCIAHLKAENCTTFINTGLSCSVDQFDKLWDKVEVTKGLTYVSIQGGKFQDVDNDNTTMAEDDMEHEIVPSETPFASGTTAVAVTGTGTEAVSCTQEGEEVLQSTTKRTRFHSPSRKLRAESSLQESTSRENAASALVALSLAAEQVDRMEEEAEETKSNDRMSDSGS